MPLLDLETFATDRQLTLALPVPSRHDSILSYAARTGNLAVVEQLIEHGVAADVDDCCFCESAPVLLACAYGHLDVVRYLIGKGACIGPKSSRGYYDNRHTPEYTLSGFSLACEGGHLDVVRYLYELCGEDVNQSAQPGSDAGTHGSIGHKECGMNTNASGEPEPCDSNCEHHDRSRTAGPPVFAAIEAHALEVLVYLCDRGATLPPDTLEHAYKSGCVDVVEYLQRVHKLQPSGPELIPVAESGHIGLLETCLTSGDIDVVWLGKAFFCACRCAYVPGYIPVLGVLLAHGADVNAMGAPDENYGDEGSALFEAAQGGGADAHNLVEWLCAHGADFEYEHHDQVGGTALEAACDRGYDKVVRVLLRVIPQPRIFITLDSLSRLGVS